MCGRYTLRSRAEIIAETFGIHVPPTLPERFNIAPTQLVLAVREKPASHQRELVALDWGLIPFWAEDPEIGSRMANARSETAATKPAFRSSFRARRCLIVADGFYEWQARDGKSSPKTLEAASKLTKRDHRTGDPQEDQEHLGLALVSDDKRAEVSEPYHRPFDGPAAAVAA